MSQKAELEKKIVGEKAVEFIEDGMIIGLGSGTTVYWMMKKLGELIKEGYNVKGIPSSKKTEKLAVEFKIPLIKPAEVEEIDLVIDGANRVDEHLNLIKGGGGSLVREKILAQSAKKNIIIISHDKYGRQLDNFPLPIEVVPFGWELTAKHIEKLGGKVTLRKRDHEIFVSDNGNYILDCEFGVISDPEKLHDELKLLPGVIETGLFIRMTDLVIIGKNDMIEMVNKKE